jgi:hypothetical protein
LILLFTVFVIPAFPGPAFAQAGKNKAGTTPDYIQTAPRNLPKALRDELALDYAPPVEPDIPEVKFLKITPPEKLTERVEALMHGIYTDIPPAYDHYGYEIRRYMAHIGGPRVLGDRKRLVHELMNVRRAAIILQYWQDALAQEEKAIAALIEADTTMPSALVTTFKYNTGYTEAFFVECRGWIANNEALLTFLLNRQGAYAYEEPVITFDDEKDLTAFESLLDARERARGHINGYAPFAVMVY